MRALVVISAGFAEIGSEGAERQERLLALVRAHGARLIGPNCLGIAVAGPQLNATFAARSAPSGQHRLLVAVGRARRSRCSRRRRRAGSGSRRSSRSATRPTSPRTTCSSGGRTTRRRTSCSCTSSRSATRAASAGSPGASRAASRSSPSRAAPRRPGQRAASSHTAALAGSEAAVDALFHQAGVIRAASLEELIDVATLLSTQPEPQGRQRRRADERGRARHPRRGRVRGGGARARPTLAAPRPSRACASCCPPRRASRTRSTCSGRRPRRAMRQALPHRARRPARGRGARALRPRGHRDRRARSPWPSTRPLREAALGEARPGRRHELRAVFRRLFARGLAPSRRSPTRSRQRVRSGAAPERASGSAGRSARFPSLDGHRPWGRPRVVERALAAADDSWLGSRARRASCWRLRRCRSSPSASPSDAGSCARRRRGAGLSRSSSSRAAPGAHKTETGGVALDLERRGGRPRGRRADRLPGRRAADAPRRHRAARRGSCRTRSSGTLVAFGPGGVFAELIGEASLRIAPLTDIDAEELVTTGKAGRLVARLQGRTDRPTRGRSSTSSTGSPRSATTCPRSPSSTSIRCSPSRTGRRSRRPRPDQAAARAAPREELVAPA